MKPNSNKVRFSANLGFLFTEHALCDAVAEAARSGFGAIECHWPFDTPAEELRKACADVGLPLLGLNTWPGDLNNGEFGLAAIAGREADARREIDRALDYADASGADMVHVMAGRFGDIDVFASNLSYATKRAARSGITILIEPLNLRDVPDYLLTDLAMAVALQDRVAAENLKIMFDCYHMQIMGGDLLRRAGNIIDRIGHIQIAAVPDRAEPDTGEVNYPWLLSELRAAGYHGYIGAEYKPRSGNTADGLGWMDSYR
ncbi:MAG: TIM barrel protein [Rhodobacteraceae bacterium]|nr:TIM barrel protein [Paracoccaceae bacterium]